MRATSIGLLVAAGLVACSHQGADPRWAGRDEGILPEGVLVLGTGTDVKAVDTVTGRTLFEAEGVAPLGDSSKWFTTRVLGRTSFLETWDPEAGGIASTVSVPGALSVRVASRDGGAVALMEPLPPGGDPWVPRPRSTTTIVVADPTGDRETTTYRLSGNFEPEAFSSDGRSLFLIRFVPPTEPTAYQVAQLDLSSGTVLPVSTGQKGVVETMSGTRLEQVVSPDGDMLYTLYTTQSSGYADAHAQAGSPVAFVHTLSLADGWAHCIALPKKLWGGDPADEAMAVSPDGRRLYVVDTARDLVAVMHRERLDFGASGRVDFTPTDGAATQAVVTPDETLFAAAGSTVVAIDPMTLRVADTVRMDAPVTALGSVGGGLLVATPGRIAVVDPSSGRVTGTMSSPAGEETTFVAWAMFRA